MPKPPWTSRWPATKTVGPQGSATLPLDEVIPPGSALASHGGWLFGGRVAETDDQLGTHPSGQLEDRGEGRLAEGRDRPGPQPDTVRREQQGRSRGAHVDVR